MKLLFSSLFIMLACALTLSCCKNAETPNPAEEQLLPISSTGAGTFGCKINGKVWVAKSNTSFPHIFFAFDRANNTVILNGNLINKPIDDLSVNLRFPFSFDSVNYIIGFSQDVVPSGGGYINFDKNIFWQTDSLRGGKVTL